MRYLGRKSVSQVIAKWLNVVWYLALIGIPFIAFWLILMWRDSSSAMRTIRLARGLSLTIAPEYVTPPESSAFHLGLMFFAGLALPLYLAAIYYLRALFREFAEDKPFTPANAKRIRIVGLAVLGSWVVSAVGRIVASLDLINRVHIPGVEMSVNILPDLKGLLLGIIILVLSEIFAEAARIKEDYDLTV